jgi:hypothetical protein
MAMSRPVAPCFATASLKTFPFSREKDEMLSCPVPSFCVFAKVCHYYGSVRSIGGILSSASQIVEVMCSARVCDLGIECSSCAFNQFMPFKGLSTRSRREHYNVSVLSHDHAGKRDAAYQAFIQTLGPCTLPHNSRST